MEKVIEQRNYSLDIIRIFAIFAVIMIHCSSDFVAFFPHLSNEFVVANIFDSISRIGVPLFLMISGALFLDESRKVTFKDIFQKHIKTLATITIIWAIFYSAIYNIVFPLIYTNTFNIRNFLDGIIFGHSHMWYLYMIIGIYIITPFLKTFVKKENKHLVLTFIIISFLVNFFNPLINVINPLFLNLSYINKIIDSFHLDFFGGYTTYFLTGWYIVNIGIKRNWIRYLVYLLGAISLVSIILLVHFTGDYNNFYENIGAPVFLYSVNVFLFLNNLRFNISKKTAKKLTTLSKLTFGVYMMHLFVLTVFNKVFPYKNNCALYIVASFLVVSFISFFISFIISKTPILKKIIKA